jgi:glycerol-3-phosphate acyltransferase PlsY
VPDLTTALPLLALAILAGYLLGSVPFGIVITKLFGLGDLRSIGSGNIGATNVLRTGNKFAALLTLILDSGKGAIAVLAARFALGEDAAQLAGFAAFFGHLFPVWLKFQGGKGVATYLGTLLALSFPVGAAACFSWLVGAALFRVSSLAALIMVAAIPLIAWAMGAPSLVLLLIALGTLVWVRHSENIKRILAGTEPKIGKKHK